MIAGWHNHSAASQFCSYLFTLAHSYSWPCFSEVRQRVHKILRTARLSANSRGIARALDGISAHPQRVAIQFAGGASHAPLQKTRELKFRIRWCVLARVDHDEWRSSMNRIAIQWIVLSGALPGAALAQAPPPEADCGPQLISIFRRKREAILPECRWRRGWPKLRTRRWSTSVGRHPETAEDRVPSNLDYQAMGRRGPRQGQKLPKVRPREDLLCAQVPGKSSEVLGARSPKLNRW